VCPAVLVIQVFLILCYFCFEYFLKNAVKIKPMNKNVLINFVRQ